MYSPGLSEKMVKTLYRLKRVWNKPMTAVMDQLLIQSLATVDKKQVCEICSKEKTIAAKDVISMTFSYNVVLNRLKGKTYENV
jgi:hypothetical protein